MKKALLAVSVLIFAFTLPAISSAGGGDDHKHGGHHGKHHSGYAHGVLFKAEELNLSDEQLGTIMRSHLEHQKAQKALMKKMHHSMVEAHKGLMNPATEEDAIRAAAKKHNEIFNKLVDNALEERSEVNNVLTEEQKNKLISMKKKHEDDEGDEDDD
ncbi:Spy/CpxP family protein refolding chaperone [Nitrosococcus watsonii]|uniref:Zinc resistance-associated protein n=1 Tax=Nitrosococcus watsoni (strain C-113) TaxID=105559 RepID=D8K7D0_NITWC|nr:Spy/CpxP family protein refolding chaperone [Nitrosococcus watsonii]ADJ28807.1 conserved hypothetical protein [Nitrosococcus watsonii C-113]